MKKVWILSLSILAMISMACTVSGVSVDFGRVEGSGNVVTETRDVGDFNEVSLDGIGNLFIEQGSENTIVIEAEDNILPKIVTIVRGDKLYIDLEHGFNVDPAREMNYYVTVKNLEEVQVSGAGSVYLQDEIQIDKLDIILSGFGSVDIDEIIGDEVNIKLSGAGDIEIAGEVDRQTIKISGAGNYRADDLHSQEADVIVSGVGDATLWVDDALSVIISGGGNIDYYGNPHTSRTISGLGNLRSLGERD
ncbi:MAG: DUF2807 domain-containing protein [Anaerolineaceae bacterium]|nr:DUF2807 domain-containing protein [Anaerolineaceae bacterium]